MNRPVCCVPFNGNPLTSGALRLDLELINRLMAGKESFGWFHDDDDER